MPSTAAQLRTPGPVTTAQAREKVAAARAFRASIAEVDRPFVPVPSQRVLRVAATIADLAGSVPIFAEHVDEAVGFVRGVRV